MPKTDLEYKADAFNLVLNERKNQDIKWGKQNHVPHTWLVILMEEVGEMAKEIQEKKPALYREELIQVAAVAMAALECCLRNGENYV